MCLLLSFLLARFPTRTGMSIASMSCRGNLPPLFRSENICGQGKKVRVPTCTLWAAADAVVHRMYYGSCFKISHTRRQTRRQTQKQTPQSFCHTLPSSNDALIHRNQAELGTQNYDYQHTKPSIAWSTRRPRQGSSWRFPSCDYSFLTTNPSSLFSPMELEVVSHNLGTGCLHQQHRCSPSPALTTIKCPRYLQ